MPVNTLVAEALVQLARKRRVMDHAQCARLKVLLHAHGVASITAARQFLATAGLVGGAVAKALLEHLPQSDQPPFGDYQPLAHLADGGMGSVWLAGSPDQRLVVVKTMRGTLADNVEVRHRFERETRFMMEMRHPNIVRCIDHGAAIDGTLFMVLEFVHSGDLKDLVESQGRLAEPLAAAVAYQIADALAGAHEQKLIHRDLKPANIFVSPDGYARLADFGIARSTAELRTMLTMQGALVGSPYYMSPEQVIAAPDLDIRCDIYALGAVLYYCLVGTDPYRGTLQEVLHAHRSAPVPDPRTLRPEVSHHLAEIVNGCMAKERDDRYRDPQQLRTALAETMAHLDSGMGTQMGRPTTDHLASTQGTGLVGARAAGSAVGAQLRERAQAAASDATITLDPAQWAPAAPPATEQVDAGKWSGGLDATVASAAPPPPPAKPKTAPGARASTAFEGDFAQALQAPWLTLTGEGLAIVLYAKRFVVMGKLVEPPVDLCLRVYPVAMYRNACLKVSRQHLRLQYDTVSRQVLVADLGSGNGTFCDGEAINPSAPVVLHPGREHQLDVAGALALRVRATARGPGIALRQLTNAPDAGSGEGGPGCGLDHDHACDALVVTRPDNRAGMAYALVLRRLTIGGFGADLVLPGLPDGAALEVALYDGRWLWRTDEGKPWRALNPESKVKCAGRMLEVKVGAYEVFTVE